MSFKDLKLQNCYETGVDNLLEDFYIPTLQESKSYKRIAGFFSSTSLAVASKGIAGLIRNGGKIELIVSPILSDQDVETILSAETDPIKYIDSIMVEQISNIGDSFAHDHIKALGWMISRDLLEVKVALIYNENSEILSAESIKSSGIFHQKVGILQDSENNIITFSGSVNESSSGWCNNIEEFKVFKSWINEQFYYCENDIRKFEDFWNNKRNNVKVISLPSGVRGHLIKEAADANFESLTLEKYLKKIQETPKIDLLSLFDYQKKAIEEWEDNNRKLLFEMATGTGKTRTAIGCIWKTMEIEKKMVVVITTPQNVLSVQWKREFEALKIPVDKMIIADSSNANWRKEMDTYLQSVALSIINTVVIFTTHNTFSSQDFITRIESQSQNITFMLVGDEVHGLGASKLRRGLIDRYTLRIGLSATPSRWFDEEGTDLLQKYFGLNTFEFDIQTALSTILPTTRQTPLVNYYYEPIFVDLSEEEFFDFINISKQLTKYYGAKDDERASIFENLLFKRANILKNASDKMNALINLLKTVDEVEDTIIFCSPEQINDVMSILNVMKIKAHKITEEQGTSPESQYNNLSERDYIIKNFKEHRYQALTAIKCLDEGIDIPTATTAIIMSSSTNPREFIQRIGRVIRRSPGKKYAYIFDMIVTVNLQGLPTEVAQFEKKLYEREMIRAMEIAQNAINKTSCINKLIEKRKEKYS